MQGFFPPTFGRSWPNRYVAARPSPGIGCYHVRDPTARSLPARRFVTAHGWLLSPKSPGRPARTSIATIALLALALSALAGAAIEPIVFLSENRRPRDIKLNARLDVGGAGYVCSGARLPARG